VSSHLVICRGSHGAQSRPEHLRIITWAQLEGFPLDKPEFDGEHPPDRAIAALEQAQANGHVDPSWEPRQLLVLLFAVGLGWAHWPDPAFATKDPKVIAGRRAAAVEAATRIVRLADRPRP
jgi:Tetracyclin repressor-like, C-terminal domain